MVRGANLAQSWPLCPGWSYKAHWQEFMRFLFEHVILIFEFWLCVGPLLVSVSCSYFQWCFGHHVLAPGSKPGCPVCRACVQPFVPSLWSNKILVLRSSELCLYSSRAVSWAGVLCLSRTCSPAELPLLRIFFVTWDAAGVARPLVSRSCLFSRMRTYVCFTAGETKIYFLPAISTLCPSLSPSSQSAWL